MSEQAADDWRSVLALALGKADERRGRDVAEQSSYTDTRRSVLRQEHGPHTREPSLTAAQALARSLGQAAWKHFIERN